MIALLRRIGQELADWLAALLTLFVLLVFFVMADIIWDDYQTEVPEHQVEKGSPR